MVSCGDFSDGSLGALGTGEKIVVLPSCCPGDSVGAWVVAEDSNSGSVLRPWALSWGVLDHSDCVFGAAWAAIDSLAFVLL